MQNNRVPTRVLTSYFYIGREVARMKYDFKDLMAFGMFILTFLMLIVSIRQ